MDKGIIKIAPSILAADFAYLGKQVSEAEQAGAGSFARESMGRPIDK